MRNNILDELVADYMGITAAAGRYRADWFLRSFQPWRMDFSREDWALMSSNGSATSMSFLR